MDEALAAVMVPSFEKAGFSDGELGRVALRRTLVELHEERVALLLRDAHRLDLGVEEALLLRGERAAEALLRELVLRLARELVLRGAQVAAVAHVDVAVRIPEAVVDHPVDERAVAHAVARSAPGRGSRGRSTSTPCRPATTIGVAERDRLGAEDDGLQARAAHLADGGGRDGVGDAGVDRRLPGGRLADAGREHVAHEHLPDRVRGELGAPSAPSMAAAPRRGAASDESEPRNAPIGVRAAATM